MSNTNPLVSVIIPVYKVEKYLKQCVDSVRNQTYTNLEIILVDDGSPDRCGEMCDEYAAEDSRIRVIHKTNGGLSDARNAGMRIARGEYLYFADSDDYLRLDALQLLVEQALKTEADIVCGSYQSFMDGYDPVVESEKKTVVVLDQLTAMQQFAVRDWGAWGKLYRRELHEDVFFPFGKIHEDEAIMFSLLHRCSSVACLDTPLYYYRTREGSITAQTYSLKKMDWMRSWIENVEFVRERYPKAYFHCLSKAWTVALYNLEHLIGKSEYTESIRIIRRFVKQRWKQIICNPYVSINSKLRVIVFLLSNPFSSRCLYIKVYELIDKLRGKA